jgi:hypothetical protein
MFNKTKTEREKETVTTRNAATALVTTIVTSIFIDIIHKAIS